MIKLLSEHLEDCSTPQYFCFSVRCEVCGEYWYSSSIPFSKGKRRSFTTPSTSGRRSVPGGLPDRRPGNGSASVPSADGWFVIPAFLSAMRWICVGSVLVV